MKKKAIICSIVMVLCIIATVALRIAMDKAVTEYSEVEVTVMSSETKIKKVMGRKQTVYEVVVLYEGERYDLKNLHGTAGYMEGRNVTAYLSNGKLYANIEGVKTSTPLATVYFIFLFASAAMVFVTVTMFSKARQ